MALLMADWPLLPRPRVPKLNLGVFKSPRGTQMSYETALIQPVSQRTLMKGVSDKSGKLPDTGRFGSKLALTKLCVQ